MRASRRRLDSGALLLRLAGAPEPAWRRWLEGELLPVCAGPARALVDLREARTVDAGTLGVLLRASRRLRAHGGELRLLGGNREVQRLLAVSGLDRCFGLAAAPPRSVGELAASPAAPVRAVSTAEAPPANGLVVADGEPCESPRQRTLTRL